MDKKDKFHKRITIVLTIICITIITAIGTIMLRMESKSTIAVETTESSNDTEQAIDKINSSETEKTKYSPEIHGLININTANKETLMLLDGIGEIKAAAIINYRTQKQFSSVSDIMNIKGIGEKTYEKIKDKICVK